jgi:C4-dicarboxylate transporter DctM subunit
LGCCSADYILAESSLCPKVADPILIGSASKLVWFGILLVLVIEVGLLTPPVGMNLYVLQSATGQPLGLITKGAVPFLIPMAIVLALIVAIPEIALWLPDAMFSK